MNHTGPGVSVTPLTLMKYSVACPVCGTVSVQYQLNARLFFNGDVDVDLQPRKFQSPKGYENLHPPLYHMWCCPKCLFAASHETFSDPLKDTHMPVDIVRKHLREIAQSSDTFRNVLSLLSEQNGEPSQPGFARAIMINLLAIYTFDQILPLLKQKFIIQARNYLRLAWLYRDLAERPVEKAESSPVLKDMNQKLAVYWPSAPFAEADALRKALDYYGQTLEDASVVKSVESRANVLQQMARIHFKLAEYRKVSEVLRDVLKMTREACVQMDKNLKMSGAQSSVLPPDERSEMVSLKRRLETLIGDSEGLLSLSRDALAEAQIAKAKAIIAGLTGKTTEEIRSALQQNRIELGVINQLAPEPVKKGFFKFL